VRASAFGSGSAAIVINSTRGTIPSLAGSGGGAVTGTFWQTTQPIQETLSEANYLKIASNGTSSVTLHAADANNSVVIDTFTVVNGDASNPYTVYLCDGACSTANWIPFRVDADRMSGGPNLKFSGTKNTIIAAKCATDCSTNLTFGITYHLVAR
jgi:hypothetical protein